MVIQKKQWFEQKIIELKFQKRKKKIKVREENFEEIILRISYNYQKNPKNSVLKDL